MTSNNNPTWYPSFEEMFIDCSDHVKGLRDHPVCIHIEPWGLQKELHVVDNIYCDIYSSRFNDWIREVKGWLGNEDGYKQHLNNITFREFLKLYNAGYLFKDKIINPEQAARMRWSEDGDQINEGEGVSDGLKATIEDYLEPFKTKKVLSEKSYTELTNALHTYFITGHFPVINNVIAVGKVNKKELGWELKKLYYSRKPKDTLSVDYLRFAHRHISTFTDVPFDEINFTKCLLYKNFTTKPQ